MKSSTWVVVGFWLASAFLNTGLTTSLTIDYINMPLWVVVCGLWMLGVFCFLSQEKLYVDKFKSISLIIVIVFLVLGVLSNPDFPIHPFKQWFFAFAIVSLIFVLQKELLCIKQCINGLMIIYIVYLLAAIIVNVTKIEGGFSGANQHQFYLSGLLGFIIATIILKYDELNFQKKSKRRVVYLALINIVSIVLVTKSRQMIPYSVSLFLISLSIYFGMNYKINRKPRSIWIASIIFFIGMAAPVLHLSGSFGNLFNAGANLFGKESRSYDNQEVIQERERAAVIWGAHVFNNGVLIEIGRPNLPVVHQLNEAGEEIPQRAALTSSHNLWLDSISRFGWLYTCTLLLTIILIYSQVLNKARKSRALYYYAMALFFSSWAFSSHFDDEHFLYHIPFITLPLIVLAIREKKMSYRMKDFQRSRYNGRLS